MIQLNALTAGVAKTLKWDTGNGDPVDINYRHAPITGEMQELIARRVVTIRKEMTDAQREAEDSKTVSTYVPIDLLVFQLTLVLKSIDVELEPGRPIDPSKYEELSKLPVPITQALYEQILGDLAPKKTNSTTSETGTQPEAVEAESLPN